MTVYPGANEPYELRPRFDLKNYCGVQKKDKKEPIFQYEWGEKSNSCLVLPEWSGADREYQPYLMHKTPTQAGDFDDRCKQLGIALAADFLGDDAKSLECHLRFYDLVKTLPHLEWQLDDAFFVLRSLASIKG